MADGGEDGIGVVAVATLEEVAIQVAVGLHVADDCLDGGAAPEFALDPAVHAAFLAGFEHAQRLRRIMAAVALVETSAKRVAYGVNI